MSSFGDQKPEIDYPCRWNYKVVGTDETDLKKAVAEILSDPFELHPSKVSKKGKYISLNLFIDVQNETHRNEIYENLKASKHIKMVM